MPVHAFVDESERNGTYLLTAAVVDPGDLGRLRQLLRGLLLPRQVELHFQKEKDPRRRQVADAIVRSGARARIYTCPIPRDRGGAELARQACVARLVADLLDLGAHRLVLDSRQAVDINDEQTIRRVIGPFPGKTALTYEHTNSRSEELLWLADALGWCYGAGNPWRTRVEAAIAEVVKLDVA
jgi:hypothetical protein